MTGFTVFLIKIIRLVVFCCTLELSIENSERDQIRLLPMESVVKANNAGDISTQNFQLH